MTTTDVTGRDTRWADWINIILGIWLFISPFVLDQGGRADTANLLSLTAFAQEAQTPAPETPAAETPAVDPLPVEPPAATTAPAGEAAEEAVEEAAEATEEASEEAAEAREEAAEATPMAVGNVDGAMWNARACGVLIVILALIGLSRAEWAEWTNTGTGVWLVLSPWILGYSEIGSMTWNAVIVGIIVAVLAAYRASSLRRVRPVM